MENNQQYDFLIYGTGISESILAWKVALSTENKVLHVDSNKYYGRDLASLSWDELKKWVEVLGSIRDSVYRDAELVINDEESMDTSRSYSFSLSPFLIYSKSKIIDLFILYKLQPYLVFRSYNSMFIYNKSAENVFFEVPYNKEMIAFREDIDFIWKRRIMRFIEFISDTTSAKSQEILNGHDDDLIIDFLSSEPFALSPLYIDMFTYGIALSNTPNITVKEALPKVKQFFSSLGIYVDFSILNCSYGAGSEAVQAFSRKASLNNATYILGKQITSYSINNEEVYPLTVILDNDMEIKCKKLITSCQVGTYKPNSLLDDQLCVRSICLIKGDLSRTLQNNCTALFFFPPQSLNSNKYPLQMMIHGNISGDCPSGQCKLIVFYILEMALIMIDVIYTRTLGNISEEKDSILSAIQIIIHSASINVEEG
ncbi:unnamed protein product [Pneumocystis jirovecii]|uniref:Rab proteins geranylgeranyltransferase component A n=1 Tax=Pneumocystis jirovecii TaxID=42068 RepID=L0PFT4_PNEJI|nr:unnamed protein product [Pneumocystis jirovecii]